MTRWKTLHMLRRGAYPANKNDNHGKARQGKGRQGKARQGQAKTRQGQGKTRKHNTYIRIFIPQERWGPRKEHGCSPPTRRPHFEDPDTPG